jgi:uncharacterized protein (UPF0248 family)
MTAVLHAATVEKEDVAFMHFPRTEVLDNMADQIRRYELITEALKLGNIEHNKVKIYFSDDKGPKKVETTVWSAGKDYVSLKKGVSIPVHRIWAVEIL